MAATDDRQAISVPQTPSRPQDATLARLQAISGLVFAVFGSLHLINTVLGAFGAEAYNGLQRALRPIYQAPIVEISLVLVPLLTHAAASVLRIRARRGRPASAAPRARAHRYAGWFLLAAVGGHVAATRGPALLEGAAPEFEGVAFTFQFLPAFFYPYYALLALAGAVHLLIGIPTALRALGLRVPRSLTSGRAARWALLTACASVLLGWAGLGGLLFSVADHSSHPFAIVVADLYQTIFRGP
jgi:succinate dehydrogenase/fumarate reductase cytochrome b subunit